MQDGINQENRREQLTNQNHATKTMNIKTAPDFELLTRLEKTGDEKEKQELLNELAKRPTCEVINQLRQLGYGKAANIADDIRSGHSHQEEELFTRETPALEIKRSYQPLLADKHADADRLFA